MDKNIEKTIFSLRARHINGIYANDIEEGNQKILSLISATEIVGIGDSTAVRQTGIVEILVKRGQNILNAFDKNIHSADYKQERLKIVKDATLCDVFLTGSNAITVDGKLVNVDAVGNRVAGMFWGHPLSIVVIGRNKIVRNLEEAFDRIRNIIAPTHFYIRSEIGRIRRKTPCVVKGICTDCRSKERGCNIFTIIEGKPSRTNLNVILINKDLGLGWDPSWPQKRIQKIVEEYKKFAWLPL